MAANLKMYSTSYIDDVYTDVNTLYNSKLVSPVQITRSLTYLYGKDMVTNIPLLTHTQGQTGGFKSMKPKTINDTQFTFPIMGRTKHTVKFLGLVNANAAGLNHQDFEIYVDSALAHKYYTIYSPDQTMLLRLQNEPDQQVAGKYKVKVSILGGAATDYLQSPNLTVGLSWVYGSTSIPLSHSDGTASNDMAPGKMKNQWGLHRHSKNIAGNVANKVTVIDFPLKGGGTTSLWMPFSLQQWQLDLRETKEHDLWFSTYNRNSAGEITDKDAETGLPVPRGAGLKEQIIASGNYSTYTTLTLAKLNSTVHTIFGNRKGHTPMEIIMCTGTAGAIQFHNAIMTEARANSYYHELSMQEITSIGEYMAYGKYYRQYKTITGDIIKVVVADFFNHGRFAEQDRANGYLDADGYPMFSSTLVFVDHTVDSSNGERNIQLIAEEGREHITKVYPGMSPLPKEWEVFSGNIISTKKDIASFEIMDSDVISMYNNTTSFWLNRA